MGSMRGASIKRPRDRITFQDSTPAPVAGLNSRDPLALMKPAYAVTLTNFIATPAGVSVREGYKNYATGMTGWVQSIMPYNAVGAYSSKLFAATPTKIYDVTNPGAATEVATALNSGHWSYTSFLDAAGPKLVMCNGLDPVRHYTGAAWVIWSLIVGTPSAPGEVTGIDPAKFESVITHMRRLWFVERNSTKCWYLPVNSSGGAAVSFDFASQFPRGGRLLALHSWSLNGGTGLENFLVAVSSNGDTVIYSGTDPSDAANWQIKGTWQLGPPVSNRCFEKFGADSLILTQDGLVPLTKYMQSTTTTVALTDTLQPTISALTASQAGMTGFQVHVCPSRNVVLLNVPQIDATKNIQFVYNTNTGGWSLFTNWPAQCWATQGVNTYFGANGKVCIAFTGFVDNAANDGSGGETYVATAQSAFNYFERPGKTKRFVRARLNMITTAGIPKVFIDCNVDWDTKQPLSSGSSITSNSGIWDSGIWDYSTWSGGAEPYDQWQTLGAVGRAGSLVIAIPVLGEAMWISTDWEIEVGGS
jgi:hypothetical protein